MPSLEVSRGVREPSEAQNLVIYMVWRPTALGKLHPGKTLLWHPRPTCNRHANLPIIILIILAIILVALQAYLQARCFGPRRGAGPRPRRTGPGGRRSWPACAAASTRRCTPCTAAARSTSGALGKADWLTSKHSLQSPIVAIPRPPG